ncbi:Glycosyl transferase CAP10 domain [Dillenia turbinata]|uniref:Glycosyl transferase CAP10 domain n=1 Tax=Dillenia turbinata TaxID=194707 RepID=A0AAN8V386_9MAGN
MANNASSAWNSKRPPKRIELPMNCTTWSTTKTRPTTYNPVIFETNDLSATECPEYFRWIHEDLKPWPTADIRIINCRTGSKNLKRVSPILT